MNRRDVFRTTFGVGAASALSARRVMGVNDRVRMGLIGSGGRGREATIAMETWSFGGFRFRAAAERIGP